MEDLFTTVRQGIKTLGDANDNSDKIVDLLDRRRDSLLGTAQDAAPA
ncbi:MAG TPA: hypothetical protein VGO22_17135 [Pseudorhizobium sp.]|jgi:hypothetical protein|nr:hypothetical protein [Pseudorhizobium sp.]